MLKKSQYWWMIYSHSYSKVFFWVLDTVVVYFIWAILKLCCLWTSKFSSGHFGQISCRVLRNVKFQFIRYFYKTSSFKLISNCVPKHKYNKHKHCNIFLRLSSPYQEKEQILKMSIQYKDFCSVIQLLPTV